MGDAFIKLHRKMLEWEWYDDVNTCRVFLHCLLRANWKPCRWHGIEIHAGQFITSLASLSEETCLTVNQVRTALDHLISTGEITSKSQSKCRIITVNNWHEYQGDHRQSTSKPQAGHKQTTTDKEYKEEKEEKNNNVSEIIDYLNSKLGTKYKANTKSTVSNITARLNEGHTVEDFKTVIDKKVKAWKDDPRMAQYLRPETLFRPGHFESYLNELEAEEKPNAKIHSFQERKVDFKALEAEVLGK